MLAFPSLALAASAPKFEFTAPLSTSTTTAMPPRLEITGNPGETIQKTIKVQNTSTSTQYYSSDVEDFIVGEDGKTPIPVTQAVSSRYSLAQWITLSPTKFALKPNETQVLDVLIQIPKDALPGGHYAMALHEPNATAKQANDALMAQGSTGTAMKIGSLLYLTVSGPVKEEAFIHNFTAPTLVEFGPVNFKYEVENRSDIHIRPQSSIEIKDTFGRVIDVVKVNEANIFPFTSRAFSAKFEQYWGLGRYTAKLNVPYGAHGLVATAVQTFWIIPYTVIIGLGLLVASVSAMFILIRRYLLHRGDTKTKEIEALKAKVKQLEDKSDQNVVR